MINTMHIIKLLDLHCHINLAIYLTEFAHVLTIFKLVIAQITFIFLCWFLRLLKRVKSIEISLTFKDCTSALPFVSSMSKLYMLKFISYFDGLKCFDNVLNCIRKGKSACIIIKRILGCKHDLSLVFFIDTIALVL